MQRILLGAIPVLLLGLGCGGSSSSGGKAPRPEGPRFEFVQDPNACNLENVHYISRPFLNRQNNLNFKYKYQHVEAEPGNPTVIFIPGGPGQGSIGLNQIKSDQNDFGELPQGWGFINTDPRGVGCNFIEEKNFLADDIQDFYNSEKVAEDIEFLVETLELDDYIIYGTSYGTLVGTILSAKLSSRDDITAPMAVYHQGIVGRKFQSAQELAFGYDRIFAQYLREIGPEAIEAFSKSPLPLGLSDDEWLDIITSFGKWGPIYRSETESVDFLKILLKHAAGISTEEEIETAQDLISSLGDTGDSDSEEIDGSDAFYVYIACQEIFNELGKEKIEDSKIKVDKIAYDCETNVKIPLQDRSFDSKEWQTSIPTIYWQGKMDPATPVEQAIYHYNFQQNPNKMFVMIDDGSHNPLTLQFFDCVDKIFEGRGDFGKIQTNLQQCYNQNYQVYTGDSIDEDSIWTTEDPGAEQNLTLDALTDVVNRLTRKLDK